MSKCPACENAFKWSDYIILVNDKIYHEDCVTLRPLKYAVLLGDEYLGEIDDDTGQMACNIIEGLLDD